MDTLRKYFQNFRCTEVLAHAKGNDSKCKQKFARHELKRLSRLSKESLFTKQRSSTGFYCGKCMCMSY